MSPYAVNSFITEREDIQTVNDNDEKEDILKPSFYKRKTFENINLAFKGYAERLKALCERTGAIYLDMFEQTYQIMLERKGEGMFFDDGIHYTKDLGHAVIAKIILNFLGEKDIPDEFIKTPENDKVFELEQLERSTGYIRRCTPMNPHFGARTEEEIVEYAKTRVDSGFEWGSLAAKNYLARRDEIPKMKEDLKRLVLAL